MNREMEQSLGQIYAQEEWHFYEELVELIGLMGEEVVEFVVF